LLDTCSHLMTEPKQQNTPDSILPSLPTPDGILQSLPTPEQLATLAATLARNPADEDFRLLLRALELWQGAEMVLRAERETQLRRNQPAYMQAYLEQAVLGPLPTPKRYPVTRDEFARLMLPHKKGRTADLATALKDYIRADIRKEKARDATPDEVADRYANWPPIENVEALRNARFSFAMWWEGHHARQVYVARHNAGKLGQKARKAASKNQEKGPKTTPAKKVRKKALRPPAP
jgi:hypothetical protein